MRECFVDELKRSIHSYLSLDFCNALTDAENPNSSERPLPGSIVGLSGRTAMPCVCEAPANSDLSEGGAKMVVEGITWQSLYLVFFGSYMVLAEPAAGRYVAQIWHFVPRLLATSYVLYIIADPPNKFLFPTVTYLSVLAVDVWYLRANFQDYRLLATRMRRLTLPLPPDAFYWHTNGLI